jgi:transposase-like protein
VSMVKDMVEPSGCVRRLEVITGVGGRRRWSEAEKARITAEAMVPGAMVSEIARRHGISPQHLFTLRRTAFRAAASTPPHRCVFLRLSRPRRHRAAIRGRRWRGGHDGGLARVASSLRSAGLRSGWGLMRARRRSQR